ncbi:SET domain-containing protein [Pleomassaria siparia CBS 279.74]|uniref:SET domain-containing protein n=1 Tax=Pleomassaria siparia CBS 279.74 TaxID=1314801 RepID=A0A6G1K1L1_9PLEO|nr:SET domain-containing protein [Pleomassaria siparia CBS 279.74]
MPSMVVVQGSGQPTRRVDPRKVHSIICNRKKGEEDQFLVRWKSEIKFASNPPLSWHSLNEIYGCLELLQDYVETWSRVLNVAASRLHPPTKRSTPDSEGESERRASPYINGRSSTPGSRASPVTSVHTTSSFSSTAYSENSTTYIDVYNGVLESKDGLISCRNVSRADIPEILIKNVPTPDMANVARRLGRGGIQNANILIRAAYTRKLEQVPGKKIHLVNVVDSSSPSLRFQYINDYVLRDGVHRVDPAAQVGCTKCSPHMGRDIGCEYTKKCDCLEYAAVDESRITSPEEKEKYQDAIATGKPTMGFPKKFPYFAEGTKVQHARCLVPFYLHSRRPIYECNDRCRCGPNCRNKNVQFGRTVELEIFRTQGGRGWGLRCKTKLYEGQFIDTYRGEIITDAEATRREDSANTKAKASYLYSLDKFAESEGLEPEDCYVVDGEFMGGPSKFINHSCEPNCRQYTVSYNKHDCRVYDIAFFACRDIAKGEELTFDYLDKEDEEEMENPGEDAIPCLCGAKKCRKWLWT